MTDGDVEAQGFKGDGSELTNVDAESFDGMDSTEFANAASTATELANLQTSIDGLDTRISQYTRWIFIPAHQLLDPYSTTSGGGFPSRQAVGDYPSVAFAPDQNLSINFAFPVPPDWDGSSNFVVDILFAGTRTPSAPKTVVWSLSYKPTALGDNIVGGSPLYPEAIIGPFYQARDLLAMTLHQIPGTELLGKTMVGTEVARNGFFTTDDYGGWINLFAVRISYQAAH